MPIMSGDVLIISSGKSCQCKDIVSQNYMINSMLSWTNEMRCSVSADNMHRFELSIIRFIPVVENIGLHSTGTEGDDRLADFFFRRLFG